MSKAFENALARSRASEDWEQARRVFDAEIDGLACLVRCSVQVIVSPDGKSRRHLTGEVSVQVLVVDGARVEAEPGCIHFASRDGAIANPEPLLRLAAGEAVANLRRDPAFRARAEKAQIESVAAHGARPASRIRI